MRRQAHSSDSMVKCTRALPTCHTIYFCCIIGITQVQGSANADDAKQKSFRQSERVVSTICVFCWESRKVCGRTLSCVQDVCISWRGAALFFCSLCSSRQSREVVWLFIDRGDVALFVASFLHAPGHPERFFFLVLFITVYPSVQH